jgi:hypothetical protein
MSREHLPGEFYVFDRGRPMQEIGRWITRNQALERVRAGRDVYTPLNSDASSLAKDVRKGKAFWEGSHAPRERDWDADAVGNRRFPHYHPGGDHETYGHVFYGERGYRVGQVRRG